MSQVFYTIMRVKNDTQKPCRTKNTEDTRTTGTTARNRHGSTAEDGHEQAGERQIYHRLRNVYPPARPKLVHHLVQFGPGHVAYATEPVEPRTQPVVHLPADAALQIAKLVLHETAGIPDPRANPVRAIPGVRNQIPV